MNDEPTIHAAESSGGAPESTETPKCPQVPYHRDDLGMLKSCVLGILILLILGACFAAQEILVPLVLALLLSLLLSPVVTFLERILRLPRAVGSLLTL